MTARSRAPIRYTTQAGVVRSWDGASAGGGTGTPGVVESALEAVVVPVEVLARMLVVVRVMLLQMTLWVLLLVTLKAVTPW